MLTVDRLRGSFLRCLMLTGLSRHQTAGLLSALAQPSGAVISPDTDTWLPCGRMKPKETTLIDSSDFITPDKCKALREWWLEKTRGANLPNWDIASTCTIEGMKGLLLVEAKAHDKELSEAGKSQPGTDNSKKNHDRIGIAIEQANAGLNSVLNGWALSRDSHYQLCNRFAWSWKLASLGVPVVLVYLGFLNATEMTDQGQFFDSNKAWEACIRNHSQNFVPADAWGKRLEISNMPAWFHIRSMELTFNL